MPLEREESFDSRQNKEIILAARTGDLAALERCITTRGSKPTSYRVAAWRFMSGHNTTFINDCMRALMHAAADGKLASVNRLLQIPGVQKEIKRSDFGTHALAWATDEGLATNEEKLQVVKKLLEIPKIADSGFMICQTPLSNAIKYGRTQIAEILLELPSVRANIGTFGGDHLLLAREHHRDEIEALLLRVPALQERNRNMSNVSSRTDSHDGNDIHPRLRN